MDTGELVTLDQLITSARGRRPTPVSVHFVRELTGADAAMLLEPAPLGARPPSILQLRNSHHQLARVLAEGVAHEEASAITGYSSSRISILLDDPMFAELVEYYRENKTAQFIDVQKRLAAFGMSCVDELQERLESDPNKFTRKELKEMAEFALDRSPSATGAGRPGAPVTNIKIEFVQSGDAEKPSVTIDHEPLS